MTVFELLWLRLTEIGEHILESQVRAKILSTLPSTYRPFYTTWNNSPEAGRTVKLYSLNYKKKRRLQRHSTETTLQQKEAMLHPTTSKILLNKIKNTLYNNLTAFLIHTQCLEEVTKEEEEDTKQEEKVIQESEEDIVEAFVEDFVD